MKNSHDQILAEKESDLVAMKNSHDQTLAEKETAQNLHDQTLVENERELLAMKNTHDQTLAEKQSELVAMKNSHDQILAEKETAKNLHDQTLAEKERELSAELAEREESLKKHQETLAAKLKQISEQDKQLQDKELEYVQQGVELDEARKNAEDNRVSYQKAKDEIAKQAKLLQDKESEYSQLDEELLAARNDNHILQKQTEELTSKAENLKHLENVISNCIQDPGSIFESISSHCYSKYMILRKSFRAVLLYDVSCQQVEKEMTLDFNILGALIVHLPDNKLFICNTMHNHKEAFIFSLMDELLNRVQDSLYDRHWTSG